MGTDVRNFFINAAIVDSKNENRVRLWLWDNEDSSNAEAFDLSGVTALPILQDVSIEHSEGGHYTMTATLVPTYEQSIPLLESGLLEETNWLEVEWGYIGRDTEIKSPLYKGQMTLPEVQLGGETSITLKTEATYGFSSVRQTSSRNPFNEMPRMDIIQAVLLGGDPPRKYEFDTPVSGEAEQKLLKDKVNAVQGGMSDWAFARRLAGEAGCTLVMEGNTVVVRSYEDLNSAKPERLFRLVPKGGIYVPVRGGVYPAFTVSSSSMYVFSPGWLSRGVTAPTVDEDAFVAEIEKQLAEDPVTEEEDPSIYAKVENLVRSGRKLAPKQTKQKKGGGAVKPSPEVPGRKDGAGGQPTFKDPNAGRNKDQASGRMVAGAHQGAVNLTIESVGVPDLIPGEIIGFEGAGIRFDGNFRVMRFTHGISSSGPNTSIEILRNASFSTEDRSQLTDQANVEDSDTSESDSYVEEERQGT